MVYAAMCGYFARFSESQPRYAVHGKDKNIFWRTMRLCKLLPRHAEIHILNIYKIKLLTIKRCGKPHLYLDFTTEL